MARTKAGVIVEPLGRRLRRLRKERRLTVALLARRCGATRAAIQDIESGRDPEPELLLGVRLAAALLLKPEYLAFGPDAQDCLDGLDAETALPPRKMRLARAEGAFKSLCLGPGLAHNLVSARHSQPDPSHANPGA